MLNIKSNDLFIILLAIPLSIATSILILQVSISSAIILIIGILVLVLTLINTDYALYMLILSMLLSPELGTGALGGGFKIRIDDLLLGVILITWLAKMAINQDKNLLPNTQLNKAIGLYILICVISTGIGMIRGDVSFFSGSFFVIKYIEYFVLFFMTYSQIRKKEQAKRFYYVLILTFTIVIIIALLQIPSRERLTTPFEGEQGEPNTLGGYLIFIIGINISFIMTSDIIKNRLKKVIFVIINILGTIALILTNSRGSWVATIPVFIGYMIFHKKRYIILLFTTLFILFSPFILPDSVKDRVSYTFQEQTGYGRTLQEEVVGITLDPSASQRIRSWEEAFKNYLNHPVLGYGITGWRFLDSQYIRVLIETGIVGLTIFLYLLTRILNKTWNIYKNQDDRFFKSITLGFFIGTIALMTHGLGANTFIIIRIMEPFWLMCGIIMAIPKMQNIIEGN